MTGKKLYWAFALAGFIGLLAVLGSKENRVNWFESYNAEQTIPYGTLIVDELINALPQQPQLRKIDMPPYLFLQKDSVAKGTYLLINSNLYLGDNEIDALLNWVRKGNRLFIASRTIDAYLTDTLQLKKEVVDDYENYDNLHTFNFYDPVLRADSLYGLDISFDNQYFILPDTVPTQAVALAYTDFIKENDSLITNRPNFVKVPFGDGEVLLSTLPEAFTNYFVLHRNNYEYTAGMLSYIDFTMPVYLDQYHINGRLINTSPLYVFLRFEKLKWAYYLALITLLLYVLFGGKRKQRPIQISKPLQNQTLHFVETISHHLFEKKQHTRVAQLLYQHFCYFSRTHLQLEPEPGNENYRQMLSEKTGVSATDISLLDALLVKAEKGKLTQEQDLRKFNTLLDTLKQKYYGNP